MKDLRDNWPVIVGLLAFGVLWGINTERLNRLQSDLNDLRLHIQRIDKPTRGSNLMSIWKATEMLVAGQPTALDTGRVCPYLGTCSLADS